jgi:hypothetical protein
MTNHLDSALRDALAELADAPPPSGLAAAAIRTARRRRQIRLAATAVVAALLVAPVIVSSVSSHDAPVESPTMEPLVVTAYSIGREGSLLLDHGTGEYVEMPYRSVTPSPDGAYALVYAGDNGTLGPVRVGVLDTATGEVRWIEGYVGAGGDSPGGWSRDGQDLLITQHPDLHGVSGPPGFAIVDSETLEARFVEHDDIENPEINAMGNRYVWAPNGDEIALTQSVEEDGEDTVTAIRFYDLDGNLTRTLPAAAPLTSEAGFSPDGTRMALQYPSLGEPIQVVDAATGEVQQTVPLPPSQLIGWADDEHLIVRLELTLLVANLAGEVTRAVPMETLSPAEVHIGSSGGLTPDAGKFTFDVR